MVSKQGSSLMAPSPTLPPLFIAAVHNCNHLLSAQVVGLLLRARKYNLVEVSLKSEFKDTFNFQINFIWTNWWYMIYDIIYIQNRMKLKFFSDYFPF